MSKSPAAAFSAGISWDALEQLGFPQITFFFLFFFIFFVVARG